MTKLTLSIDKKVIEAARRASKKRGTSISKMVEGYLKRFTKPISDPSKGSSILSLRGIGGKVPKDFDYRKVLKRYLDERHR